MPPNQIHQEKLLPAPLARVWQAIGDANSFGQWFGVEFDGPFVAGQLLTGRIVPTLVDPEVAKLQERHRGKAFEIFVETVEALQQLAFRWHPFAIDPNYDYAQEPMTLVTFTLTERHGSTLLTITESGFEQLPEARRALAFAANEGGWGHQVRLIEKYLSART